VFVDIIKLLRQMLHLIRGVLNEIAGLYELAFICGLLHDCLIHIFISLVDALN
jgi:hypothetical protein